MLPRKNRVLTAAEFRQGFRSPARHSTSWASFYLVRIDELAPSTVGFVVSGLVGNAVVRNRVKRKLREAARYFLVNHPNGYQLTLKAKPEARDLSFGSMTEDFQATTSKLLEKIG